MCCVHHVRQSGAVACLRRRQHERAVAVVVGARALLHHWLRRRRVCDGSGRPIASRPHDRVAARETGPDRPGSNLQAPAENGIRVSLTENRDAAAAGPGRRSRRAAGWLAAPTATSRRRAEGTRRAKRDLRALFHRPSLARTLDGRAGGHIPAVRRAQRDVRARRPRRRVNAFAHGAVKEPDRL